MKNAEAFLEAMDGKAKIFAPAAWANFEANRATKNMTGNEIHFLGHFAEYAVLPGTLIVEAVGQAASILFSKTTGTGTRPGRVFGAGIDQRDAIPQAGSAWRQDRDGSPCSEIYRRLRSSRNHRNRNGVEVGKGKLGFAGRGL